MGGIVVCSLKSNFFEAVILIFIVSIQIKKYTMKKTMLLANWLVVLLVFFAFEAKAQVIGAHMNVTDFRVAQQQNKILINWTVDSTTETNYFEVEKSVDGKNFKTVAYVLGADPIEKNCECFRCFDPITAKQKEAYYRLKHVSENGSVQYSETKILALK
jgi:hypothetical protein